jgi:hypothetical protein
VAQQKINLRPKGLYTNVNQLGTVPAGALSDCENVVLSRPNVLGVRRGRITTAFFASLSNDFWSVGTRPLRLFNAKLRVGGILANNYLGQATPGVISMMANGDIYWTPDGITFTKVNPVYGQSPMALGPSYGDRHFYGFEQSGSFYVSTSSGVVVIGRPLPNTPVTEDGIPTSDEVLHDWSRSGYAPAGAPWGINTKAVIDAAGTGSAIASDSQIAYRFCFGYRDSNNAIRLGAPSSRAVAINPSGGVTENVTVSTTIPPGVIPTRHFWQLYRSQPSSSDSTDPGDDLGLIAEGTIPEDVSLDQAARSGSTATVRSTTPHGLHQYENFVLKESIIQYVGTAANEFFITGPTPSDRSIYKKVGYNNTSTLIDTFTVTVESQFAYSEKRAILFVRDTVNGAFYYMEKGVRGITYLNDSCEFVATESIGTAPGFIAELAVWDQQTRKIYCIGRFTEGAYPFQYNTHSFWCVEFDPVTKTITNQVYSPPFNAGTAPESMHDYCKMGIWRANNATNPYWCVALIAPQGRVAISSDKGASWTYQYLDPIPSGTAQQTTIDCEDTVINPTTQETTFAFGANMYSTTIGGWHSAYVNVYYINNSGTNTPMLRKSPQSITETVFGTYLNPFIHALRANRTDGTFIASIEKDYAGSPFGRKTFMWLFYSAWVPSDTATTSSQLAVPSGMTVGFDRILSSICDGIEQSGTQHMLATWFLTDTSSGDEHPVVYDCYNGTYTILDQLGSANNYEFLGASSLGLSASGTALIPAGTYEVASVIDTTHFTFLSVQSPAADFTTVTVDVLIGFIELFVTDTVAPDYIGPYLYSSPSVEGSLQMNFPPPFCKDASLFRTTAFFANTTQRATMGVTMLKLPSVGELIYLGNSTAYCVEAGTTENVGALTFKIGATGTLSQKIKDTIDSIARVVNCNWRLFNNIVLPIGVGPTAYSTFYVTGVLPSDTISLKHTASDGTTLITGTITPNDVYGEAVQEKNLLYYSKTNIADAVPLLNYLRIGSDSKEIIRTIASRDALFVFKEDGCFIVRGYGPPWQVDPFDLTLQLSLRDSLVTLDNAVFGAFKRGVFKVSDSNAELLSLPIQDQIEEKLAGGMMEDADSYSFGAADNADHKYLLWLYDSNVDNDDYPSEVKVYDTFTNEWTTWNHPARHALAFRDQRLLFAFQTFCLNGHNNDGHMSGGQANGDYPSILMENRTLTDADFFDDYAWRKPDADISATDPHTSELISYDSVNRIAVLGDAVSTFGVTINEFDVIVPLGQGPDLVDALMPNITSPVAPGNDIPILNTVKPSWITEEGTFTTPMPVQVYRGIRFGFKFVQAFPESPAATNHFSEVTVSFRKAFWSKLKVNFELPVEQQDPSHVAQEVNFDGTHHFGPARLHSLNNFIRTYVPRQSQRGTTIVCGIETGVCGITIESNGMTIVLTQGPTSFQRR